MRITHPFHPRFGDTIDVIEEQRAWREHLLFYRDVDGHIIPIPAAWTTRMPVDPFLVASGGRSLFRFRDLVELAEVVAELGRAPVKPFSP